MTEEHEQKIQERDDEYEAMMRQIEDEVEDDVDYAEDIENEGEQQL